MKIMRRPGQQPGTEGQAQRTKAFNMNLRYVQGIRAVIAGSSTTQVTITLNSSGREILGVAIIPTGGNLTDFADTQVKFVINNNNLLLSVGVNNLVPNYVQNMIFFPCPQPLQGNDSISMEFTKNDAVDKNCIINIFYIPRV